MDPAILADSTDNCGRRGSPVTETRATTPEFPPGRYGRRRDGRRRVLVPALLGAVVLGASLLLGVKLYQQYGDPTYDSQVVSYTQITDTSVLIEFRVRISAGGSAACVLRARAYDGAQVGRRVVTVASPAGAGEQQVTARETVTTTARPFIGEVVTCRAASA
jgi:hypothetical protein